MDDQKREDTGVRKPTETPKEDRKDQSAAPPAAVDPPKSQRLGGINWWV